MDDNVGGVDIRLLTAADWQAFRGIRLRALADSPAAFGSTLESAQARTEQNWRALLAGVIAPGDPRPEFEMLLEL